MTAHGNLLVVFCEIGYGLSEKEEPHFGYISSIYAESFEPKEPLESRPHRLYTNTLKECAVEAPT
jgi:hypothetical protein